MDIVKNSKQMSWLLRHGAQEAGVAMDAGGWIAIGEVLRVLRLSRGALDAVVAQNDKKRFEIDGDRIRAVQGHSRGGTGVEDAALEATWTRYAGSGLVHHGTEVALVEVICREGIRSMRRTHVHLAPASDSVVGKRARTPVLLGVSVEGMAAAGEPLFQAPNGVVLARFVPPGCIVSFVARTRAAEARGAELAEWVARAGQAGRELADPCGAA